MGLFSRKKQILALDIGSYAIKYALLDNTGKDIVVRFAGQKLVPPQEPGVGELEGATIALKQLAVELDLVKKKLHQVVFAIPSSLAIVRFVTLPPTPLDRVKAILRGEAEQHIPFSIDDVAMDTQILRADDKGVEAIIVAVKQEKVDEYVNLVQVAGLTPEVIDVSAFSLFNVFRFTEGEKLQALAKAPEDGSEAKEPVVALLDMGASTTDISVCQGGKLMLTRSVAISGNSLTDAVSRRLNVSPLLAERYKKAQGRARTESAEPKEEKKTTTGAMGAPRAPMGEMAAPKISLGAPKTPGLAPGTAPSAPPPAPALAPAAPAAAAEEAATQAPAAPSVSTEGGMQPPPAGLPTPQAPAAPAPPAAPKPPSAPAGLPTPQAPAAPVPPSAPAGLPTPQAPAAPKPPSAPAGLPTPQAPAAPKPPSAPAGLPTPQPPVVPPAAKPEAEGGLQIPSSPPPPPSGFRLGGPKPPAPAAPAPPAGVSKMLGSKLAGDQSATGGSGLRRPPAAPGGGLRVDKPAAPPTDTPPAPPPPPPGGNSVGAAKAEAEPAEAAADEVTVPLENKAEDIESAIKPMLDRLVGELKRSFDYFKAQIINEDIGKIYLCGGGAQLKDLATFLQQKTGIETEVLNPLQKLSVDGVDLGVELGSAFGLGLRVAGYECAVQTNLLPADIAIRKRSLARQRNLGIMGVLGVLLAVELVFAGWWVYDMRVTERDDILAKLEELKEVVEKVKTLKATQEQLTSRKNLIMRLSLERARWLDVLRELNNILAKVTETPGRKVWLQTLSYTSKEACSLSGMASDFDVVGELNQRLNESSYYEVEGFPSQSKDAVTGMVQFNFSLRVTQAPDMEELRRRLEQAAAGGEGGGEAAPAEGGE